MAETHEHYITKLAGEALVKYRRVKLSSNTLVYADASDGDSWIGITMPGPDGGDYASGAPVTVCLRSEGYSMKVECSATVVNSAVLYPEDDGKVSDDAGTVTIGWALSAGSGAASIIEMVANAGSGSSPDEEAIADSDGTTGAGIVIGLTEFGLTALATTHEIAKPARKLKLIKAWGTCRDGTTDSAVLLKVGSTAICAAITFTATDETVEFQLTDAITEVAAASTIYASIATALTAPGMDIYALALPIA